LFIETANEVRLSVQFWLVGDGLQMRDILMAQTAQFSGPEGSLRLDIYLWLSKITLDLMGLAGT
jgi:hypothetical protein